MEAPRGDARLSAGEGMHPAAATGFARSAAAYERGRPGYPDDAVDALVAALPGRDVVDLAAGTGKLTRALAARGCDVVAVEPVAQMRAEIGPPARVVDGLAEATTLASGSADAVTVAQAFHWFDRPRALAEIHRVLRPGGMLALVWNTRRMQDDVHQRIQALLEPLRGSVPAHRSERWRVDLEGSPLFGELRELRFANEQVVDAAALADRVGSISFVAALEQAERAEVLERARALAGDGVVTLRYVVELQLATRVG
jgi:SAM-dependent methyltransferase